MITNIITISPNLIKNLKIDRKTYPRLSSVTMPNPISFIRDKLPKFFFRLNQHTAHRVASNFQ